MTFVDEGKLKLNDAVGKFLTILTAHSKGNKVPVVAGSAVSTPAVYMNLTMILNKRTFNGKRILCEKYNRNAG